MPLSFSSLTLTDSDQASLQIFVHWGRANARTLTRARLLLKLAAGWTEAELCAAFEVSRNTGQGNENCENEPPYSGCLLK